MPKYDFECQGCSTVFEVKASLAEYAALVKDKKLACAACGSNRVVRVFTPPNLGSGKAAASGSHHCGPGCKCQ